MHLTMFSVLFFVLCLSCIHVKCQEPPDPVGEVQPVSADETSSTTAKPTPSYLDYILQFSFALNEAQVPSYIIDLIYDESTEDPITTYDVLNLFHIETLDLNETLSVLERMNISSGDVLSIEGFEVLLKDLKATFKDIYDKATTSMGLSGQPLRQFLIDLSIDADKFSSILTFGPGDPYEEFRKGSFSKASVEAALTNAGKTPEQLFSAVREQFVPFAVALDRTEMVRLLNKRDFGTKSALDLWDVLDLSLNDVTAVANFNSIITKVVEKFQTSSILGVLKGPFEGVVNSVGYDVWKEEPLALVSAESFSSKTKVQVRRATGGAGGIVSLNLANMNVSSETVTYAVTSASRDSNLGDCIIVTADNGNVISSIAMELHNHLHEIHVGNSTIENSKLVVGSPLICRNSVFGLLKSADDSGIVFNTFYDSGSASINSNSVLLSVALAVLLCYTLRLD